MSGRAPAHLSACPVGVQRLLQPEEKALLLAISEDEVVSTSNFRVISSTPAGYLNSALSGELPHERDRKTSEFNLHSNVT